MTKSVKCRRISTSLGASINTHLDGEAQPHYHQSTKGFYRSYIVKDLISSEIVLMTNSSGMTS